MPPKGKKIKSQQTGAPVYDEGDRTLTEGELMSAIHSYTPEQLARKRAIAMEGSLNVPLPNTSISIHRPPAPPAQVYENPQMDSDDPNERRQAIAQAYGADQVTHHVRIKSDGTVESEGLGPLPGEIPEGYNDPNIPQYQPPQVPFQKSQNYVDKIKSHQSQFKSKFVEKLDGILQKHQSCRKTFEEFQQVFGNTMYNMMESAWNALSPYLVMEEDASNPEQFGIRDEEGLVSFSVAYEPKGIKLILVAPYDVDSYNIHLSKQLDKELPPDVLFLSFSEYFRKEKELLKDFETIFLDFIDKYVEYTQNQE